MAPRGTGNLTGEPVPKHPKSHPSFAQQPDFPNTREKPAFSWSHCPEFRAELGAGFSRKEISWKTRRGFRAMVPRDVFSKQPAPRGGGGAPRHVMHRRTRHRDAVASVHRAGGQAGAPPRLETILESAPRHLPEKFIVENPGNCFAKEWFSKYPKNPLWIFHDFGHDQQKGRKTRS